MMHLLLLAALAPVNARFVDCRTGVFPDTSLRATLDMSDNRMEFFDAPDATVVSGVATRSTVRGTQYFQLTYGFGLGVQLLLDGSQWWLCQDQNVCLRCGQFLNP